jgi:hypothetical protein
VALGNVLQLSGLNITGWLLVLGASVVPLIVGQIYLMSFKANLLEKAKE